MANKKWLFASTDPQKESTLFAWVLDCCEQQNFALDIVVVLPKLSHHLFEWFETQHHENLLQKQIEYERSQRQSWLQAAEARGVKLTIEVRFGKFFYEVVKASKQTDIELLIKQAEDMQENDSLFFQSVDWHLLRKSPIALLLYRANTPLPFKQVMASLDVDIETQPYHAEELNQKLLCWAEQFTTNLPVKVVHAWQADLENLVRHWNTDISKSELNALNEQVFYEHKQALQVELEAYSPGEDAFSVYYAKGEPAESIAAVVLEQKVDLLVLGTLARDGLPGLLIGNTAEDILERVNCSVLAIKPATFKTPII